MANSLNLCQFIGRLGKPPELRYTKSGDPICNFSIACSWKTKDKEGTEWIKATAFGKVADICGQYLKVGSQVYIAGRMTTRKWVNKDGADQYSTEINVDNVQLLGSKSDNDAPVVRAPVISNVEDIDSDLPF